MEHHAVDFTLQHLIALLPLLVTSLTAVVVMLAIAARRNHALTFILSVVGLNPVSYTHLDVYKRQS